jgi:hypothetical protein
MWKRAGIAAAIGVLMCVAGGGAMAGGDMATKATKLPELNIGGGDSGYNMSPKSYDLETGKAYRLHLKATGDKECVLRGAEFFSSIYVRQIAAGEAEILNPTFTGFEFDDPSEAELYFVPVRTGKFTIGCTGLEEKGMKVEITVK